MAETFYTALGVADDADREVIRRAYREQVKEHHPDVSDDPDASERFKRLTTARDVLVDDDERDRYDRLGHDAYVREFVESTAWTPEQSRQSGTRSTAAASTAQRGATDDDRAAWTGETATAGRRRRGSQGRRQQARAAATGASTEDWQRASSAYRRADVRAGAERSRVGTVLSALKSVGPWLLVHLVFVGSAAATAWLTFTQLETYVDASWPTLLFSVSLVALVVFASALHVVSQLYS